MHGRIAQLHRSYVQDSANPLFRPNCIFHVDLDYRENENNTSHVIHDQICDINNNAIVNKKTINSWLPPILKILFIYESSG